MTDEELWDDFYHKALRDGLAPALAGLMTHDQCAAHVADKWLAEHRKRFPAPSQPKPVTTVCGVDPWTVPDYLRPKPEQPKPEADWLVPGARVRVVTGDNADIAGTVERLDAEGLAQVRWDNGFRARHERSLLRPLKRRKL